MSKFVRGPAVLTSTSDPLVDVAELAAPTSGPDREVGPDAFGVHEALSADGTTALIGSYSDYPDAPAAWVYTRGPGATSWSEQRKFTGVEGTVALSADGSTAVIGDTDDESNVGSVWIYTRTAGGWTGPQKLTPPAGGRDAFSGTPSFGAGIAVSATGTRLVIGGPNNGNATGGAAWVYTRGAGGRFTEGQMLTAPSGSHNAFGAAVAMSRDGSTTLIGAPGPYATTSVPGHAWAYTLHGDRWARQAELTGTHQIGLSQFGTALALSNGGSTALIGSYDGSSVSAFGPFAGPGAAWVFTRAGTTWYERRKLTDPESNSPADVQPQFGGSVALSGDGATALIGADTTIVDGQFVGAAWRFTSSSGVWSLQQKLSAPPGYTDPDSQSAWFGSSVALTADGSASLVGSSGLGPVGFASGPFGNGLGAAFWFVSPAVVTRVWPDIGPASGGTQVTITGRDLGGAMAVSFGGVAASSFTVVSPTEVTAVAPPGKVGSADVRVTTPEGASAASSADRFTYTLHPGVPGAPTGVTALPGDHAATVSFAPAPDDGSPITGYTVIASPGGAQASGISSPITVSGLADGTAYSFTVRATNAIGVGPVSAPSDPVTPIAAPTPPAPTPPAPATPSSVPTATGLRLGPTARLCVTAFRWRMRDATGALGLTGIIDHHFSVLTGTVPLLRVKEADGAYSISAWHGHYTRVTPAGGGTHALVVHHSRILLQSVDRRFTLLITRRRDGAASVTGTQCWPGAAASRTVNVAPGHTTTVPVHLTTSAGEAIPGASVIVTDRGQVNDVRTDASGTAMVSLRPGPTRTITLGYAGAMGVAPAALSATVRMRR